MADKPDTTGEGPRLGPKHHAALKLWAGVSVVEIDLEGQAWIENPVKGRWLTAGEKEQFLAWLVSPGDEGRLAAQVTQVTQRYLAVTPDARGRPQVHGVEVACLEDDLAAGRAHTAVRGALMDRGHPEPFALAPAEDWEPAVKRLTELLYEPRAAYVRLNLADWAARFPVRQRGDAIVDARGNLIVPGLVHPADRAAAVEAMNLHRVLDMAAVERHLRAEHSLTGETP
jgi:hypothetical protein